MFTPRRFLSVLLVACASFAILPQPASAVTTYPPTIVALSSFPTLRVGTTGAAVQSYRHLLRAALWGGDVTIGSATYDQALSNQVKSLQRWFGLTADGAVGAQTWKLTLHLANVHLSDADAPALPASNISVTAGFGGWLIKVKCAATTSGGHSEILAYIWSDDGRQLSEDCVNGSATITVTYEDAKAHDYRKGHVIDIFQKTLLGDVLVSGASLAFTRLP